MPTITLHATGSVVGRPGGATPTVAGTAPQWGDGSDATYASGASSSVTMLSALEPLTLPAGATVTQVRAQVRAVAGGANTNGDFSLASSTTFGDFACYFDPTGSGVNTTLTNSVADYDLIQSSNGVAQDPIAVLTAGGWVVAKLDFATAGSITVYEFTVFVDYALPTDCFDTDVPATDIISAPGSGTAWTDASLESEDASGAVIGPTLIEMAEWFSFNQAFTVIGKYGTGANKFNFTVPDGFTVTAMKYVIKAYRESSTASSSSDPTSIAAASAFGSIPASVPAAVAAGSTRSEAVYFPDLAVTTSWADAFEVLIDEPDFNAVLVDDNPFDKFAAVEQDSFSAVVKWDYLAIRVTCCPVSSTTATVAPPLRLTNRDDAFSSARRLDGSSSRQGSNRLTGYL